MATFDYDEAVYGALCFIFGDSDGRISVNEKEGIMNKFQNIHYLSPETMKVISYKWSQDTENFYSDVINSLNEYSLTKRLEANKTICIIINDYFDHEIYWAPANKIRNDVGITRDEYKLYI